jgi:undecaprenyl diphosphate synthase
LKKPDAFTSEEEAVLARIDRSRLPQHVAMVMDGNGRWARKLSKERLFGHHHGRDSVRMVIRTFRLLGIPYVTLYTFSSENWSRSKVEVAGLMKLLEKTMAAEEQELFEAGVRLRLIGRLDRVPEGVARQMRASRERLDGNRDLTMTLAIDYGARDELVRCVRRLAEQVRAGELSPGAIDEARIGQGLDTAGIPDPELLLRTGGELRISNYLLWQCAYSEFWFTDKLWPDLTRLDLFTALADYQSRDRRFGGAED